MTALAAGLMTRRASFAPPASLDTEARSFSATIATSTAVRRPPPTPDGSPEPWDEVLSLDPRHVDLSRIVGGPLLFAHDRERHLGTVTGARIENGVLIADLKLSRRAEADQTLQDIADRVIQQVSAGFTVQSWRRQPSAATGVPRYLAERWTPLEVSVLPLAADGGCRIRSYSEDMTMPDTIVSELPADAGEVQACSWTVDDYAGLVQSAEKLGVRAGLVAELRTRGLSVEAARDALLDHRAERDRQFETRPHRTEVGFSHDAPDVRAARMGEALFVRANPGVEPSPAAREFIGLSLPQLAAECLQFRGFGTRGVPAATIITRALHTTSDFSLTLGDAAGRALKAEYLAAQRGLAQLATTVTASDFKAKAMLDVAGDTIQLEKVNEAGEFRYGTLKEGANSVRLETYGKIIGITRQAIVNDDLDAFGRLPRMLARSAVEMEDKLLASLLQSNPTLGDGVALFAAGHGNLAGSGAAISEETLSAGRAAMRGQTGINGGALNIAPAYLVVAPAAETLAEKTLSAVQATTAADANPFSFLRLIVDARLSGTSWYLVAAPTAAEALIACHLEGQEAPLVESRAGWNVDGVEIKCRHDYGCAFIDHRPWYKNAG